MKKFLLLLIAICFVVNANAQKGYYSYFAQGDLLKTQPCYMVSHCEDGFCLIMVVESKINDVVFDDNSAVMFKFDDNTTFTLPILSKYTAYSEGAFHQLIIGSAKYNVQSRYLISDEFAKKLTEKGRKIMKVRNIYANGDFKDTVPNAKWKQNFCKLLAKSYQKAKEEYDKNPNGDF